MFSKAVICLGFLAVAIAEKPRVGLQMPPFLSLYSPQVVGGEEAPVGSYPFIVSLQFFQIHICAGSILNERWIITAGHCVKAVPSATLIIVKAGKHNIKIIEEDDEQTVSVKRGIVHENFESGGGPYDIALLELKSPLKLTNRVQPIELPALGSEPTGEAWLCGWGSISNTSLPEMPDKLQHVKVKYIDRGTCSEAILRLIGFSPVHKTNICTGPLNKTISACGRDSGGPLISRNGEEAVLTGIVSWGLIPCGKAGAPTVYTKVSKFTCWIAEKINDDNVIDT